MSNKSKNELVPINNKDKGLRVKDAAWNSLSEETKKAYSSDYKIFFDFIKKDPKNVTADDILKFIEDLENKNYKNRTINRKLASLSKMFKVMVIAGEIKVNPIDVLKQFRNISFKTSKSIHVGLDLKEVKQIVKVTKKSSEQEKKIILVIRTLGMTGLRISEFTGIKNSHIIDFDKDNKQISVVGKGNKERKIFLPNEFIKQIREIFPYNKDIPFLFYNSRNKRYDRKVLWSQIKDHCQKRIGKHVHPHMFRHWFASHKLSVEKQDLKAVSLYLGHSDASITLNFYVDTTLDVEKSKIKI